MRHPEQLDSEIFLTNIFEDKDYNKIGWISKRKGIQAYRTDDTPIKGFGYPVFVNKSEITEALNGMEDEYYKNIYRKLLNT